jgi:hypothetical protein
MQLNKKERHLDVKIASAIMATGLTVGCVASRCPHRPRENELAHGIKAQAAQTWVDAVSADGAYGRWAYTLARKPSEVKQLLAMAAGQS